MNFEKPLSNEEQKKVGSNEIERIHLEFEKTFSEYFNNHEYSRHAPAPLIDDKDNSVIFTGASINALKPILLSADYGRNNGRYIFQECLRTQALDIVFDNQNIPFGQPFFHMASILSRPGRFAEVVDEAIDFMCNHAGVRKEKIKIISSSLITELNGRENIQDILVCYDSENLDNYEWSYGIPGVFGRGLSIQVYNDATNSYWDVGNVVKIQEVSGKELGTEFGFGYEFFLAATTGKKDPVELARVFDVVSHQTGLFQKYFTFLEAAVHMKKAGVIPGKGKERFLYKKFLQSLQCMGSGLGKSTQDILTDMEQIYASITHSENKEHFILEEEVINRHDIRKKELRMYASQNKAAIESYSSTTREYLDFISDIFLKGKHLGIDQDEVKVIIAQLSKNENSSNNF